MLKMLQLTKKNLLLLDNVPIYKKIGSCTLINRQIIIMAQEDVFKKLVSHCKEYGVVFPLQRFMTV